MPTYRNDSTTKSFQIKNYSGETVIVRPGFSVETQETISMTDLTLTAATPYYNPCVQRDDIVTGGAADQTVTIHSLTNEIDIVNGTSDAVLTYYLGAKTNLPAIVVAAGMTKTITGIKGMYSSSVVSTSKAVSSGAYVHQYK